MAASLRPASDLGSPQEFAIGQCAALACLLEATAPKAGNVHRGADFEDLTFPDFVASAVAVAPHMEQAAKRGIGPTILDAIKSTRQLVGTNTNLGAVLLLTPLAAVPRPTPLAEGISDVLAGLTPHDAGCVYEAIRLARPGGLGRATQMDVVDAPPDDLRKAMGEAAERDLVARQYTNNFTQVLGLVAPALANGRRSGWSLMDTIVYVHVQLMAEFPDSLIARKCGPEVALVAARKSASVLKAGTPGEPEFYGALADLDFWMRSDYHRRNPGTSADMIAAGLFVALRDGLIRPPYR